MILEEAGGTVTDLDGAPYVLGGPHILATNGRVHDEVREVAAIAERGAAER